MNLYLDHPGKSKTTMDIFKEIYTQHGIRGLFAGSVPRLIKVAPACAIMISSFEYGKVFFNRLANQHIPLSADVDTLNVPQQKVPSNVSQFKDTTILSRSTSSPDIL